MYAGQLTADDKNRINAISRKVMRHGLTLTAFDIDAFIDKSDRRLFCTATHIIRTFSLLKHLPTVLTNFARGNIYISFPLFNIRNLKIVISIVYWNIYYLPLLTSCCVSEVFSLCFSLLYQFILWVFTLCVLYFTCILFVFFAVTVCECHIEIKG